MAGDHSAATLCSEFDPQTSVFQALRGVNSSKVRKEVDSIARRENIEVHASSCQHGMPGIVSYSKSSLKTTRPYQDVLPRLLSAL